MTSPVPRTVLICHAESRLNREGVARWLASFSDLAGIVLIIEGHEQTWRRVRREIRRIGPTRFLDALAFRAYYALTHAGADNQWMTGQLAAIEQRFPSVPASTRFLRTPDPNSEAVREFLQEVAPDIVVARCKRILHERIFTIPTSGTFVLHPGVCPEYRNAHGAFWALAERDLDKVGLTLLRIDKGVDTGPVYGYFSYPFDEVGESHIVVMSRLLLENLDAIRERLLEVWAGRVEPVDTAGRRSATWGQPWLTKYLRWKREARRRRNAGIVA